jgi:hypothetical protein
VRPTSSRSAHCMSNCLGTEPFIEMGSAEEDQNAATLDLHAAHATGVSAHGGGCEVRNRVEGGLERGGAELIRSTCPSRAQYYCDVMHADAASRGNVSRGLRCTHAWDQPSAVTCS